MCSVGGRKDKSMKKAEFVSRVAAKTGLKKNQTRLVLEAVLDEIGEALSEGEKLNFIGFGVFERKYREESQRRLPGRDDMSVIAGKYVPVFRAGKELKEKVNKKV